LLYWADSAESGDQGLETDPIKQFEISRLIPLEIAGVDASITNAAMWMMAVVLAISVFMLFGIRRRATVPGRSQAMVEMLYEFVAGMVRDNAGNEARPYFPFIFTLFVFILGCNLAGLLPYSFTVTSHIVVTFALAMAVFVGVTIVGFVKHGLKFLRLFAPEGVPLWLLPLITPMEIISYFIRPISLSVRLFANMLAGHLMLTVFAGFVVALGALGVLGVFGAALAFAFEIALTLLELLVAVLQAYVFAILSCIYLNDALHPAH